MLKNISLLTLFFFIFLNCLPAQTSQKAAIEKKVEQLRKAMVDADSVMLDKLTSDKLSYGHSGGHVDDKKEFVSKITSGKSDFVTMELTDQNITISKKVAIVRHKLNATTNDNGKPGEVHLSVLQVWQKLHADWILLARQAVKAQ